MVGEAAWPAAAILQVDGKTLGPFALDVDAPVTIGRTSRAGLRCADERMPRELATIRFTREGWILENERQSVRGRIAPMRVRSEFISTRGGAVFAPRARVLLQPGFWVIEWVLAARIAVTIYQLPDDGAMYPLARDKRFGDHGRGTLAIRRFRLTDKQRIRMAALYAPLMIEGGRARKPQYGVAAELIGCSPEQLKSTYQNVLRKVNVARPSDAKITDFEDLGLYLIDVEGAIGSGDLPK